MFFGVWIGGEFSNVVSFYTKKVVHLSGVVNKIQTHQSAIIRKCITTDPNTVYRDLEVRCPE